MAVVLTLVLYKKKTRINIHERDDTKNTVKTIQNTVSAGVTAEDED